jgi:hypothetical protein
MRCTHWQSNAIDQGDDDWSADRGQSIEREKALLTSLLAIDHHLRCCCLLGIVFAIERLLFLSTFIRSSYRCIDTTMLLFPVRNGKFPLTTNQPVSIYLEKESRISCLEDLPNEILLLTFKYLRSVDVLRAFYSDDMSDRFHSLIFKYRTRFDLSNLCYSDFRFLIDHIFSQSDIVKLSLCNYNIPCLIEHFSSLCQETELSELVELELDNCTFISPSLLAWISKQLKLESCYCSYFTSKESPLSITQRNLLRDFIFNHGFAASLHTLSVTLWPGFVLSNQSLTTAIEQLRSVQLDLDTFDDLCILLEKNVIPNVRDLLVFLNRPRQSRK